MGREIRRVPPFWAHPRYTYENDRYGNRAGEYHPMHDQAYREAAKEWKERFLAWEASDDKHKEEYEFWEWDGMPPKPDWYLPEFKEEPTWFQVYETVSEGTPVSPPFATGEELVDYLVAAGDFWCQNRPDEPPPSREAAEAFVLRGGWVPSMSIKSESDGTTSFTTGIQQASEK